MGFIAKLFGGGGGKSSQPKPQPVARPAAVAPVEPERNISGAIAGGQGQSTGVLSDASTARNTFLRY